MSHQDKKYLRFKISLLFHLIRNSWKQVLLGDSASVPRYGDEGGRVTLWEWV
jgi:hypothetical protein